MDLQKIAVLGAGTMGPGIAATYAANGYEQDMEQEHVYAEARKRLK